MKKQILLLSINLLFLFTSKAQSLKFDGTNDFVTTPIVTDAINYDNWTFECWAKSPLAPNTTSGQEGPMYSANMGILWNHLSGFFGSAFVQDALGNYHAASFGAIADGVWYHFAATYDGDTLKAYKNGELMNSVVTSGGVYTNTLPLSFGRHPSVGHYWEGNIDEARIWNTERTCSEINSNMNSELTGTETGLMAYYKFNDGVPSSNNTTLTAIQNKVSNTNDGILNNFALTGTNSNFAGNTPFNATVQSCTVPTSPANSLKFDGVDDYVDLGNLSYYQLNSGTIEAWIKTSDAGTGYRGIVVKEFAYGIFLKDNVLTAFHWSTGTETTVGPALNDNQWHHVAYVFGIGANASELYIDGILAGTSFTHAVGNQTGNLNIGNNASQSHFFNGYIDEVRIWADKICPDQLMANRNCESPTVGSNLKGNFHFNQGIGGGNNASINTLNNATGSNHGALQNFLLSGTASNWSDEAAVTTGNTCTFSPYTVTVSGNTITSNAPGATSYQWYDCANNTPIPSATSASYIATASGNYSVQVTIGTCVIGSDCGNITVTGINETNSNNTINIYPNPTSSILNIEVKEQTQITIVNVLGEVVKTETIKGLRTIDVTELHNGVYFIQSTSGIKTKFIKQ
jgi:hypothetical protein